jgi:5-oxoprolinase (ATP-hydrolysing)
MKIEGPAIILNKTSTILVEPESSAVIDDFGNVEIDLHDKLAAQDLKGYRSIEEVPLDPIELSIFGHRFMSIAEQMGITLQQTSASTNIKERLDFSCALFDPFGNLVANAPHVPVHLGSMQDAVKFQVQNLGSDWREGEVILTNHPTAGGTHLPDMTVITPVYEAGQPVFYVASRGHHADIGGIQPGSMPAFSKVIEEEGAAFVSFKIVKDGQFNEEELTALLCNQSKDMNPLIEGTRNLKDNLSDFRAQIAANTRGILLVHNLIEDYSLVYVQAYMLFI